MNKNALINLVAFQSLWFSAVIGSSYNVVWPCFVVCALFVAWQLKSSNRHPCDIKLLLTGITIGLVFETLILQLGLVEYQNNQPFAGIAPAWLICLWIGFALTINHSLKWLKTAPCLATLFGFIGGPLSYYAGLKLGAISYLANFWLVSVIIGIIWAMTMLAFVMLAKENG